MVHFVRQKSIQKLFYSHQKIFLQFCHAMEISNQFLYLSMHKVCFTHLANSTAPPPPPSPHFFLPYLCVSVCYGTSYQPPPLL